MYDAATHGTFDDSYDGEEDQRAVEQRFREKLAAATGSIISRLETDVTDRIQKRQQIERRWIEDLRQFHGRYPEQVEAVLMGDPDRSSVFINVTRPKTRDWSARVSDMLFPNDDKNWGIKPTPVPELTEESKQAVKAAEAEEAKAQAAADEHNQMVDAGGEQGPDPAALAAMEQKAQTHATNAVDLRAKEKEFATLFDQAKRRAQLMEREIDDQLVESRFPAVCRDIIDDATKLGPGILKGPLTAAKPRRRWIKQEVQQEDGTMSSAFALSQDSDPRPMFRRTDPWHFFPDPDATSIEDNESTFERHLLGKAGMRRKGKMLGWDMGVLADILRDPPSPTTEGDYQWLTQLRMMEKQEQASFINRYCVWEYHGPMERDEIAAMIQVLGRAEDAVKFLEGSTEADETPMVIIYFCQGKLLKIEEYFPLDSGESLYSVFPFEKAEASILGAVGVPYLMRHEQSMLNGAVRMMMDNGGLSVGPQIVIDKTQIEPEDGSWKLRPRKVWKKKGQDISRDQAPFATYNIPMNQAQLQGIIELALRFIDMVVSMPTIAQGEQGAHVTQTSSGMSMLFNSANVVFRRVVKNWDDDLTTPVIRRAFDWNMQFNPKDEIKGDMQADARGTSVLLVREVQSQQLMLIAQNWSTHPVIGPALKVYDVLRMTLQALNISPNEVLCDLEEFEKRIAKMAESQGPSPEEIRAQAQVEVANITAQTRREEGELQMRIAEFNQKTEILKLIQKDGVDMARVEALMQSKAIDIDHKERLFTAEAAIEARNAQDARAHGEQPQGSGGYISAGGAA